MLTVLINALYVLFRYCGSPELQDWLTTIEDLAIESSKGEPTSERAFGDAGRWLMLMLCFFNGARRQATELLANAHLIQSQRASEDESRRIKLDREKMQENDLAYLCVGALKVSEQTGKTDTCQLVLPKPFLDAVHNYMLLKKGFFGAPKRDDTLFVTRKGQALSMSAAIKSQVAKDMFKVMGITKHLLPGHQRIVLATRMQREGCTGDTGMDHQQETQKAVYHNEKAQEGIANKKRVQAKALRAAEDNYAPNPDLLPLRDEQDGEHRAMNAQWVHEDQVQEEWNLFCSSVASRQPYKKVLSSEKVDLLRSIFAVDDPEWSCLFLSGEEPVSCGKRLDFHFKRYLMSPGPNMDRIRQTVANISVLIPGQEGLLRKLTHILLSSFRSMNKTRKSGSCGGLPRHAVLNISRPSGKAVLEVTGQPTGTDSGSREELGVSLPSSSRPRRKRGASVEEEKDVDEPLSDTTSSED